MLLYWVTTALLAATLAAVGLADLLRVQAIVAGLTHLGYPAYLSTILGVWQLLGAAAILAPGLPRVKEWAYAGICFTFSGAAVSHAAVGDPIHKVLVPLVLLALVFSSRALQPERLGASSKDWLTVRLSACADSSRWS